MDEQVLWRRPATEPAAGNASSIRPRGGYPGAAFGADRLPPQLAQLPIALAAGALALAAAALVAAVAAQSADGAVVLALGLLAAGAAAAVHARPALAAPLVVLALPGAATTELFGVQASPLEAVVGGAAVAYAARLARRSDERRLGAAHWAYLAFLAAVAFSVVGPVDRTERIRDLLFWGALGLVLHAATAHLRSRAGARLLLAALAVAALAETSFALFEYVDRFSERFSRLGGAIVYPLPQATLQHSNALGAFVVLAGLAVLALGLGEPGRARYAAFAVAGACAAGAGVTFSRGAWIALAAGSLAYLLERGTRRGFYAAAVAGGGLAAAAALAGGGAVGDRISSIFSGDATSLYGFRLELAERAAAITAANPITGAGEFYEVGVYAGRPTGATHPHNLVLGLTVFYGIAAALAMAVLVFLAVRAARRGLAPSLPADARARAAGLVAVLVALLVNGLFEYPFWNEALTALVVVLLAAVLTFGPGPARGELAPLEIPAATVTRAR